MGDMADDYEARALEEMDEIESRNHPVAPLYLLPNTAEVRKLKYMLQSRMHVGLHGNYGDENLKEICKIDDELSEHRILIR